MEKIDPTTNKQANLSSQAKSQTFLELAKAVLASEPERSREVAEKRFGLTEKKPQTLEKIGEDYNITRERVRQIIADVTKKIAERGAESNLKRAEERIIFTIDRNNGIMEEEKLIQALAGNDELEANAVVFFGAISKTLEMAEEKGLLKKSWITRREALAQAKKIAQAAKEILEKERKLLNDREIAEKISQKIGSGKLSGAEILSYLETLAEIKRNAFGRWGLVFWKEVTPKGTRERIYLVLKEKKTPLHFTEIAKLIDTYKLGKRLAHPQTVHNELIKDERFVLVGRGIYALKEWGYEEGTIKDVLEDILKKSPKPLNKEEILAEVLRKRKVKKATVMINLNNPKIFTKERNLYTLKK